MAEKNYKTVAVVPEMPRTIDNQQLHIYTPVGSTGNFGVFKPDGDQFVIVNGVLRADASKLIQLADTPAIVVENGGRTKVTVSFTKPNDKLNRKFQFIFENIKGATGATGATGAKGDTGDNALVYSGSYTETYAGDVMDEPIHLDIAKFSRTPVKGDTFVLVYYTTETEQTTISLFSIYNVYDTYVEAQAVFGTQYVITGPKGEQGIQGEAGTPGKDGDDGVSITSVTQTGVQGGTQVTITLSNGQSTSFIVYNGINTNFQVVNTLPTENISTSTIYLVPSTTPGEENIYDEYIYVNGNWEHIGSTTVDLSDYVTKTFFNQNVGDATKNYVATQVAKVHNLYIKMYESGSVPVVGQELTLTNANFARVPVANQYFGLLEVVNTKDKYYSVCKILSVDTTTCSANVVAVTEVTNGTEIDSIKASISELNTDLDGKADTSALDDKLDKDKTITPTKQVYAKNADGTQGMVNVGGTAGDDIATVGQVNASEPYHIELTSRFGTLTQEQFDKLAADDRSYVYLVNEGVIVTKSITRSGYINFGASDNTNQYLLQVATNLKYSFTVWSVEDVNNKKNEITGTGNATYYPTTKAVADYVAANAPTAYYIRLNGTDGGNIGETEFNKLSADKGSYILLKIGAYEYKLCRNAESTTDLRYSVVNDVEEYTVIILASDYSWSVQIITLENTANRVTEIKASSADEEYPSAAATYTYGQTVLTTAKSYTDTAIANAITTALNTPV